jgi:hypothetical protein
VDRSGAEPVTSAVKIITQFVPTATSTSSISIAVPLLLSVYELPQLVTLTTEAFSRSLSSESSISTPVAKASRC